MRRAVRGVEGQRCGVVDAALPPWRCEAKPRIRVRLRLLKTDPQPGFRIPRLSLHWRVRIEESKKYVVNNYSKTI